MIFLVVLFISCIAYFAGYVQGRLDEKDASEKEKELLEKLKDD